MDENPTLDPAAPIETVQHWQRSPVVRREGKDGLAILASGGKAAQPNGNRRGNARSRGNLSSEEPLAAS